MICEGNWTEAEKDPDTFRALVQEEVAQGWLEKVGALEQAQARWPDMVAVGRCNLVKSEGRETRLVLDSSVPNASFLIPEKYSLPGLSDVRAAWPLRGRTEEAELFAVDIRAAHKSVRDAPATRAQHVTNGRRPVLWTCPLRFCLKIHVCDFYVRLPWLKLCLCSKGKICPPCPPLVLVRRIPTHAGLYVRVEMVIPHHR